MPYCEKHGLEYSDEVFSYCPKCGIGKNPRKYSLTEICDIPLDPNKKAWYRAEEMDKLLNLPANSPDGVNQGGTTRDNPLRISPSGDAKGTINCPKDWYRTIDCLCCPKRSHCPYIGVENKKMKKGFHKKGKDATKLPFELGIGLLGTTVEELLEKLASLEHEQWMSWSKYIAENEDIQPLLYERWQKNWKPYSELSEEMKEKDRRWARKVLELLEGKE